MDVRENLTEIIFDSLCRHIDKSCKLAENIADDILGSDLTVWDWISVDKRLPEEKSNYIVYYKHAFCDDENHVGICVCFYDGNEFEMDFLHKVTHWMLLPTAPKGE